jgi:antitoxin component of MazEF toxin-antitoxin module
MEQDDTHQIKCPNCHKDDNLELFSICNSAINISCHNCEVNFLVYLPTKKFRTTTLKEKSVTIDIDEAGMMKLPDEIIEKFDLHSGDEVHFKLLDNGSIEMTFPKKATVDIEISDKDLLLLMKEAHKQDITFNQLAENIIRNKINEEPIQISLQRLEKDFDIIMRMVEGGATYIINDTFSEEPLAILIPYEKYEVMIKGI